MKKMTSLFIAFAMLISCVCVANAQSLKLVVNGKAVELEDDVIVNGGEVYIPMRSFCEFAGYDVKWDNDEKCAVAVNGDDEVKVYVGKKWVKKNGLKSSMANESVILNEKTYMPKDALKGFDAEYSYDEEKNVLDVEISLLNGKYFIIKHCKTGKVIMPENKATGDGTLIVLADEDGSDVQIWRFLTRGAGIYRPENRKTLRSIDMPNWRTDEGLELIMYGNTEGTNQWIKLKENDDGTYAIVMNHSEMFLGATENGTVAQYAEFDKERDSFELVEVKISEDEANVTEFVRVEAADTMDGKLVSVENNGIYKLILQGKGHYVLRNKDTGKFLTTDGEKENFSDADVFELNGDVLTKDDFSVNFDLPTLNAENYASGTVGGRYYRLTNIGCDKIVGIKEDSASNGEKIVVKDKADNDGEIWAFASVGNNKFVIINKEANLAIDIPAHSTESGTNATVYSVNYGGNQIFEMIEEGEYAFLKNQTSELYLTENDGYITQEEFVGDESQKFILEDMGKSNIKVIGATATLFLIKGEDEVTNAKLQWNEVGGATSYDVFKSINGGEYEFWTNTSAITIDDYDLNVGDKVSYRIYALEENGLIDYAETEEVECYELPEDLKVTSNITPSNMELPNGLKTKDGVYYKFEQWGRDDGKSGFGKMMVRTSTDDVTYSEPVEVMNVSDILNHETCKGNEMCRFESVNYRYNPDTDTFAFIAHYEADGGYGTAKTSFATMKAGEKMIFHGAIRPGGDDTRDLNVYVDDDNTAYVMSAVHGNANLAIYRLKKDWSGVEERVALINNNLWRELPNVLKKDGIYYLFTSGCAGWYPTPGMYNSATSMEGVWSELRSVGNQTTFSAQSGGVYALSENSQHYIMNPYRWMYYWKDAVVKTTQSRRYPVTVSNGYAFYDFFEELLYNVENDVLIPVQRGKILSQEKPAGENGKFGLGNTANDGKYNSIWKTDRKWPYVWEVDLGEAKNINQVQISWMIWNSSEAYYNYKIEGSIDGENYVTLVDKSEGYTDYGFTVDNASGAARYVRVTVLNAKPRNSEQNTYPSELYEVKILGD